MVSDELIINIAKSRIGELDQNEINQKDELIVPVTINDDGSPYFYSVKFHREKINNALGWMFVAINRK